MKVSPASSGTARQLRDGDHGRHQVVAPVAECVVRALFPEREDLLHAESGQHRREDLRVGCGGFVLRFRSAVGVDDGFLEGEQHPALVVLPGDGPYPQLMTVTGPPSVRVVEVPVVVGGSLAIGTPRQCLVESIGISHPGFDLSLDRQCDPRPRPPGARRGAAPQ